MGDSAAEGPGHRRRVALRFLVSAAVRCNRVRGKSERLYLCMYVLYVCISTSCSNDDAVYVVGVAVQLESDRRERKDDGSRRDDVGDASG